MGDQDELAGRPEELYLVLEGSGEVRRRRPALHMRARRSFAVKDPAIGRSRRDGGCGGHRNRQTGAIRVEVAGGAFGRRAHLRSEKGEAVRPVERYVRARTDWRKAGVGQIGLHEAATRAQA
jgi:hypothetical protein